MCQLKFDVFGCGASTSDDSSINNSRHCDRAQSQPGAGALTQRHERLIKATAPSSIGRSPFNQRLHAAAQCFCCNHKAARLAFEYLHLGPCSRKLHPLAAARASHVLAVTHWNMSPSRNSQGGPLGPETSPSAGTVCNNRAN